MRYVTIGGATSSPRRVSALALGAMRFGTATEESTAFAILDHFLAAGGNFIDTANNYAWSHDGGRGGQSEALLGRWRASRGLTDEVVIATKVGARPTRAGIDFANRVGADEGLSPAAIHAAARESRERLGIERIDLLYAHVEDPRAPVGATVAAFGALESAGEVALLGVSNHRAWRASAPGRSPASPASPATRSSNTTAATSSTAPTCPARGRRSAIQGSSPPTSSIT